MSRAEEYQALLKELEPEAPGLEQTYARAQKRLRKKRYIWKPLATMAAAFLMFVVLVNTSESVAGTCANVPFLCDLAEAVSISKSLTDAAEHHYVQELYLEQEKDGIKATIEYVIVDERQLNIFYHLENDLDKELYVVPEIKPMPGAAQTKYAFYVVCSNERGGTYADKKEKQMKYVTIEFEEDTVPEQMCLVMQVKDAYTEEEMALFTFDIEIDTNLIAKSRMYTLNQDVMLGEERVTIQSVEVFPTHVRVNVTEHPEDTAWLRELDFYLENEDGERFESSVSGISATGSSDSDSKSMICYRAESPYFYESRGLTLCITGAKWLDKDKEKVYVNLAEGQIGELPECITRKKISKVGQDYVVTLGATIPEEQTRGQILGSSYYDKSGKEYHIRSWSGTTSSERTEESGVYIEEEVILEGYPFDEVVLSLNFTRFCQMEEAIRIQVK